jgi:molybdate transport system ATP-binding protein
MPDAGLQIRASLPLRRFTLEVALEWSGRALAILGPSGSGKTSLLEAICGLRSAATGRILLRDRALLDTVSGVRVAPEHRRIGYVPQDALLFPHLRARDNVRYGLAGPDAERRYASAVEIAEIQPLLDQWPGTLSGGERQRVALARALASGPELLVLDEPLAALDVELKQRIFPYLLRIRDEGRVPLIYVTHHWGEARALADQALLLEEGRVKAFGSAAEVLGPPTLGSLKVSDVENIVSGTLETAGDSVLLRLSTGTTLHVPGAVAEVGRRATYALPAEDVLLSTHPLTGVSARNVFPGRIIDLTPTGPDALVRLDAAGTEWLARLTAAAARELRLEAGATAHLAVKTHSFRRLR